MAQKRKTNCAWHCPECNKINRVTSYNILLKDAVVKIVSVFCNQCRAHQPHKRKDLKKPAKN